MTYAQPDSLASPRPTAPRPRARGRTLAAASTALAAVLGGAGARADDPAPVPVPAPAPAPAPIAPRAGVAAAAPADAPRAILEARIKAHEEALEALRAALASIGDEQPLVSAKLRRTVAVLEHGREAARGGFAPSLDRTPLDQARAELARAVAAIGEERDAAAPLAAALRALDRVDAVTRPFPIHVLRDGDDVRVFVARAEAAHPAHAAHPVFGAPVDVLIERSAGPGALDVERVRIAGEGAGAGGEARAVRALRWAEAAPARAAGAGEAGAAAGGAEGRLLMTADFEPATATAGRLTRIELDASPAPASTGSILAAREDRDVVVLANGDRLGGDLESASATEVVLATRYGQLRIPRDDIAALLFRKPAQGFLGIAGANHAKGVELTAIVPGSPAERTTAADGSAAPLAAGQVIVAVEGLGEMSGPLTLARLTEAIRARKPGTRVTLHILDATGAARAVVAEVGAAKR